MANKHDEEDLDDMNELLLKKELLQHEVNELERTNDQLDALQKGIEKYKRKDGLND